jgi:membrane protease YdiL (CAAX protease family)
MLPTCREGANSMKRKLLAKRKWYIKLRKKMKPVTKHAWLVLLFITLLVGTQMTLIWNNTVGLYMNVASLLILLAIALIREDARKVSISLAIIPVAQMVTSTILMPNSFYAATIFYDTILLFALTYRYLFALDAPIKSTRMGARAYFIMLSLMVVLGQMLGLLTYAFLRHHYVFTQISLPLVAACCFVFAFAEEMLLRGLVQQQAAKVFHPAVAAFLTSILYVILTIGHAATLLTLGPAIVTGIVLSVVYYYKQNLILTTTINAFSKLVYVGLIAGFILR